MFINEPFEVFYDGECPLCVKEISLLRYLDRHDRIIFTDIMAPNFQSERDTGRTFETLMGSIHGRMADGTLVDGVEVFRQLYGRVGFKSVIWATRLPGVRHLLDAGYTFFARNRLRFTGRCLPGGACDVKYSTKHS